LAPVKKIKAASAEELTAAKGVGPALAAAIVMHFSPGGAGGDSDDTLPAINMTTGEVLET
jgi:excinuclease ABC subunit C